MKKLNIRPRRTVRVVLFTNEENGPRGGNGYRDAHAREAGNHVLALESDSGVFAPARLGFSGSRPRAADRRHWRRCSRRSACRRSARGGGGADIGPIAAAGQGADDGVLRRLDRVLHDSPHAGRHRGSHRAGMRCRRPPPQSRR